MKITGKMLKAERKRRGMTQPEMSRELKVPFRTVQNWEATDGELTCVVQRYLQMTLFDKTKIVYENEHAVVEETEDGFLTKIKFGNGEFDVIATHGKGDLEKHKAIKGAKTLEKN